MDDYSDDSAGKQEEELAGGVIKASELIARMSEDLSLILDNQARTESDLRNLRSELRETTKQGKIYNNAFYGLVILLLVLNLLCLVWAVAP